MCWFLMLHERLTRVKYKGIPFICTITNSSHNCFLFLCSCDCWKQTSIYFGEIHTVRQMSFQQHLYVLSSGKEDMNCFNQNFVDNHYKNDDIFQILSSLILLLYDKKIQNYEILFRWTFHFPRSIKKYSYCNICHPSVVIKLIYCLKPNSDKSLVFNESTI